MMAYGGFAVGQLAAAVKQVKLERASEQIVEVGYEAPLRMRIVTGSAEIFGTEIAPQIWLFFPPALKFAPFPLLLSLLRFSEHPPLIYGVDLRSPALVASRPAHKSPLLPPIIEEIR